MPSDHSDIWTGIGAAASGIVSTFAWLYSIGLLPVSMFITGAFFTLWTQERFEKKKRKREFDMKMTDHIYGPLVKELRLTLGGLEEYEPTNGMTLDPITEDYRFGLVEENLSRQIKEFRKRLHPYYTSLWSQAWRETETHAMMELGKHKINLQKVSFAIFHAGGETFNTTMVRPIFEDKTPLDYLTEKMVPPASKIVYVHGKSEGKLSDEHRIHQISKDILEKVRKNPFVNTQRKEREYLIKECSSLIDSIKERIVL